ncbi:MAG: 16S rRNA (guanine(966)-N(2))-methyltransferase RsmD [Acidimicrobiales bacterium]|nr:16S rRNA (guanine(966)-N(2))-methyltransferase RsmD [Acidimicrobiales bacterium]
MSRPTRKRAGALRVVAGDLRGRRFDAPPGTGTRPTSDRVRQATFNALESMGAVHGAVAIDAFAGSGALGIEALSRGAASVTFVDTDPAALEVVRSNVRVLGLGPRAEVVARTAAVAIEGGGPWDLVLLDPPYAHDGWVDLLEAVERRLAPEGVVVIESDREVDLPGGLVGVRTRTYGGTVVRFAVRSGAAT